MKQSRGRVIFDVTISVLSLIIVILTIIVLTNVQNNIRLLPVIFLFGSGWNGIIAARESGRRSSMSVPIGCALAALFLLFFSIRGFVMYWAGI